MELAEILFYCVLLDFYYIYFLSKFNPIVSYLIINNVFHSFSIPCSLSDEYSLDFPINYMNLDLGFVFILFCFNFYL